MLAYGRQIAATEYVVVVAERMIHRCFFSLLYFLVHLLKLNIRIPLANYAG